MSSAPSKSSTPPPPPAATRDVLLHHDPELFVGNLTPTHKVLLNKFNVQPYHILVCTRESQPQTGMALRLNVRLHVRIPFFFGKVWYFMGFLSEVLEGFGMMN